MNIYLAKLCQVSDQNKYLTWYARIIQHALNRSKLSNVYTEAHHIVPKSFQMGGEVDHDNLVTLSAREHIVVHRLLTKFSRDDRYVAALRAYHCMVFKTNGGKNKRRPTLGQLASARDALRIANAGPRGIKGPPQWSGCSTLDAFRRLLIELVAEGKSDPVIASQFGISATAVHNWRQKLKLGRRRPLLRDKAWLYDLYINQLHSCSMIANVIGCTDAAVQIKLQEYGIPVRTGSERQRLKYSR